MQERQETGVKTGGAWSALPVLQTSLIREQPWLSSGWSRYNTCHDPFSAPVVKKHEKTCLLVLLGREWPLLPVPPGHETLATPTDFKCVCVYFDTKMTLNANHV